MTILPSLIAIAGLVVLIGGSMALLAGRPQPQPVPVRGRRTRR